MFLVTCILVLFTVIIVTSSIYIIFTYDELNIINRLELYTYCLERTGSRTRSQRYMYDEDNETKLGGMGDRASSSIRGLPFFF